MFCFISCFHIKIAAGKQIWEFIGKEISIYLVINASHFWKLLLFLTFAWLNLCSHVDISLPLYHKSRAKLNKSLSRKIISKNQVAGDAD